MERIEATLHHLHRLSISISLHCVAVMMNIFDVEFLTAKKWAREYGFERNPLGTSGVRTKAAVTFMTSQDSVILWYRSYSTL
jgi:hypothetical protein